MQRQTPYKIRLHIMSPVHIGCDDVYEPTGFVVDKAAKKLIAFDPVDFVRSLNAVDRKKFLELCDKGTLESIVEIYKFMSTSKFSIEGQCVDISGGFIAMYDLACRLNTRNTRQLKSELNQFKIERTSYLPVDNAPYIPGSALKGALRTGWLNHRNNHKHHQIDDRDRQAAKNLEKNLLEGAFDSDPFSAFKVSDLLPSQKAETSICFAVNRKPGRLGGPYQIVELIRHGIDAVFEGILTIHQPEQGSQIRKPIPATVETFGQISSFYLSEMDADGQILKSLKQSDKIKQVFQSQFGDQFLKTVFPIRIGRHSGAQSVTIDGARRIKIKNGRPPIQPKATSMWLAGDTTDANSNLLPFGWVALEVLELDPTAALYSERITAARLAAPALAPAATPNPAAVTEQILWEAAVLGWNPGNTTLSALSQDGKKAEAKIGSDRSLVSDEIINRLKKGKSVKAKVTLEKEGNALKIVSIECSDSAQRNGS